MSKYCPSLPDMIIIGDSDLENFLGWEKAVGVEALFDLLKPRANCTCEEPHHHYVQALEQVREELRRPEGLSNTTTVEGRISLGLLLSHLYATAWKCLSHDIFTSEGTIIEPSLPSLLSTDYIIAPDGRLVPTGAPDPDVYVSAKVVGDRMNIVVRGSESPDTPEAQRRAQEALNYGGRICGIRDISDELLKPDDLDSGS